MPMSARPREVLERLLRGITGRDFAALHELYAEDAVVDLLFTAPSPTRFTGREEIRRHFAAAAGMPLEMEALDLVVHETGDPEVIVAEWNYAGRITTTGEEFRMANIVVLRIRDGRIAASRDYHDHGLAARARNAAL